MYIYIYITTYKLIYICIQMDEQTDIQTKKDWLTTRQIDRQTHMNVYTHIYICKYICQKKDVYRHSLSSIATLTAIPVLRDEIETIKPRIGVLEADNIVTKATIATHDAR